MSLMMMLAMGSKPAAYVPTPYSKTFTKNESFPMPAGVSVLTSIIGHGGPGQPAVAGTDIPYTNALTRYFKKAGGTDEVNQTADGWDIGTGNGTDYCEPLTTINDSDTYYASLTCYYYRYRTEGGSPATTGASATGFGKVFPGGAGGAAADTTFPNVPVTAGAPYAVVVPAGGSITITYKV